MAGSLGLGNTSSAFGERGIAKRVGGVARHRPLRGGRLLDLGCGDGAYTVRLAEGYSRIDAVDIEPHRLSLFADRIRGSHMEERVQVHEMSAARLEFPDCSFDRVTAFEVIEHIEELPAALGEVRRVLKPGGVFSLTTPNRWFPFETHGVLVGGRRRSPLTAPFLTWVRPLHRRMSDARTFTRGELRAYLARAGLRLSVVDFIMPPFDQDRPLAPALRRISDGLERGPLRGFGMALVASAEKPA